MGTFSETVHDDESAFFSGWRKLDAIEVGSTRYPLRGRRRGMFCPDETGQTEFQVEGFGRLFRGRGNDHDAAFQDWCQQVHVSFQQLIRTRHFEMGEDDRRRWAVLEAQIDVGKYRKTTPITLRQVGQVLYHGYQTPQRIRWANGAWDRVDLSSMPAPLAALRPNQTFEAVVRRHPLTGRLLEVVDVQPLPAFQLLTKTAQTEYLNSLPTGDSLPVSHLDLSELEQ